jgi:hypothetical protein
MNVGSRAAEGQDSGLRVEMVFYSYLDADDVG